MIRPKIVAVDLFCGVGGKTHGFLLAGLPVVAGFDNDPTCKFAYEENNPGAKFHCEDITNLSANVISVLYPVDCIRVLIGCAPCQPFSTYSRRYKKAEGAEAGESRWDMLRAFKRLIAETNPDIVSAENVPDLARSKDPAYLEFVSDLLETGYEVTQSIVKCADYGIPQTRERLVILASRLGKLEMPQPTHGPDCRRTVRDTIGKLEPISAGGSLPTDPLHMSSKLSPLNLRRVQATPEGGGWTDWPEDLRLACHRRHSGTTYPSVYGRMAWDDLAPTITTQCFGLGNGRFGHPDQNRAISLREAALLQTFPKGYVFAKANCTPEFRNVGRHIGNAVPVRLAEVIAKAILSHVKAVEPERPGTLVLR